MKTDPHWISVALHIKSPLCWLFRPVDSIHPLYIAYGFHSLLQSMTINSECIILFRIWSHHLAVHQSLMSPVGGPFLLLISILGFQCVPICCYSDGKVSKVCGSMVPHHRGKGETSPSPYQLQTNTTTFSPKDQIRGNNNDNWCLID